MRYRCFRGNMTNHKANKFKTSGVPILASSGPSMEKVFRDFIYLSLKSQDTQKTYYFATTNFLNFCFSNGIEDLRDIEPGNVREYLDHRIQIEQKEASSPTHFYAIKAMLKISGKPPFRNYSLLLHHFYRKQNE